ncbi:MAG: hypothetical protein KY443_07395 [Actinobacteria bacterium]|nr:hypothetical protein [Actinomycetota bacterium]
MTWRRLDAVAAAPLPWMRRLAAHYDGPLVVGGTLLVSRVARGIVTPAVRAVVAGREVPVLGPSVAVRLTDAATVESSFEGAAQMRTDEVGACLATAMAPLVDAVRAAVPVGRRALWGLVADAVGQAAVDVAGTSDDAAVRSVAEEVNDAVAPGSAMRPTWFPVEHEGGRHVFLRRAACCLLLRSRTGTACTSCPRVEDEERRMRLESWLSGNGRAAPTQFRGQVSPDHLFACSGTVVRVHDANGSDGSTST